MERDRHIEYDRTRPSAQQSHPTRIWITGRRCDACEAVRLQEFYDAMRDRDES